MEAQREKWCDRWPPACSWADPWLKPVSQVQPYALSVIYNDGVVRFCFQMLEETVLKRQVIGKKRTWLIKQTWETLITFEIRAQCSTAISLNLETGQVWHSLRKGKALCFLKALSSFVCQNHSFNLQSLTQDTMCLGVSNFFLGCHNGLFVFQIENWITFGITFFFYRHFPSEVILQKSLSSSSTGV